MIYGIIIVGTVILVAIFSNKKEDHSYKAEFGSEGEFLSTFNHGFAVTGQKSLTRAISETNCALFGPTGSGKSSSVIISSAISLSRSIATLIFNDVSGEIWVHTSAYLKSKGYRLLLINFSAPEYSECFNPLAFCTTVSDIQKLALLIIRNSIGENKGDPFWENASMMILSLMGRYLVFHAQPEFKTIQNVLHLVETFSTEPQKVDKLFIKTKDEELLRSYKAMVAMGDKTFQSVISTLRTALNLWIDASVCQTTANNTIDFDSLRETPTAIYLNTPLKDLSYYKPISALFIQTLFNHVLSRIPRKDERSIFFVLDEFATYKFPSVATTISNIRKYKAGLLLSMQDEAALVAKYGQAEAHQIKTNCGTQVYLKGQPLSTCRDLSQILGKYSYEDEKGIERTRELLTPDEIRMSEKAIILINNQKPLLCKMTPHFKNIWISNATKMDAVIPESKNIFKPQLIPFE